MFNDFKRNKKERFKFTETLQENTIKILNIVDNNNHINYLNNLKERLFFEYADIKIKQSKIQAISNIPTGMPIEGKITSDFGLRIDPIAKTYQFHTGIDISDKNINLKPIKSIISGKVETSGYSNDIKYTGYGNFVIINNGYYKILYGHLYSVNVRYGQIISKNTYVGNIGSTGASTGPHLHYGIIIYDFINPMDFMK
jgi:murein DD-endopeptidase MepM/ murein hydrolase activator NlpD